MGSFDELKEHRIALVLFAAMSTFLFGAAVYSTMTYSSVVQAQVDIGLMNADQTATANTNGTITLRFSVDLDNPTDYLLHVASASWQIYIENGTSGPYHIISLGLVYTGPTAYEDIPTKGTTTLNRELLVSDSAILARLNGFFNYSASIGKNYTVETAPYTNDFRLIAWLDDFKHDYDRDLYLNDLVAVDLRYLGEA